MALLQDCSRPPQGACHTSGAVRALGTIPTATKSLFLEAHCLLTTLDISQ